VRSLRARLEFLTAFLDDAALRDAGSETGKFGGPYAGWNFTRLEVRDFAALIIHSLLELPIERPKGRFDHDAVPLTPADWERFRSEVRKAAIHWLAANSRGAAAKEPARN
jgi:hypothetical protein